MSISARTIEWWLKQSEEARKEIYNVNGKIHFHSALGEFYNFYGTNFATNGIDPPLIWGNGADFDIKILDTAYQKSGYIWSPWKYTDIRCFRTFKKLFGEEELKLKRKGTAHNALDDAIYQAQYLINICQEEGIELK